MLTTIAPSLALFPRRRQRLRFRDARPRVRMAIKHALREGQVTGEEAEALAKSLEDDDLLKESYSRMRLAVPEGGRDWAGFAAFIKELGTIVIAVLQFFKPAAAANSFPDRRMMQQAFVLHAHGPDLHGMAMNLLPGFKAASFDFNASDFQRLWLQFSEAIDSALRGFNPLEIRDVVEAMHTLQEALANYDGYRDLPGVVTAIAAVLSATFNLFGGG